MAIDVKDVIALLGRNGPSVCDRLFPNGRHHPGENRFSVGGLSGEPGQSLSVYFGPPKPGNWKDFATDERGDILDLVAQAKFGGNKSHAMQWALDFLDIRKADPERLKEVSREAEAEVKKQKKDAERRAGYLRGIAWRIWKVEASADLKGTPVEAYLAGRGIDLGAFRSTGALRYHPDLLHKATGSLWPAMVACIYSPAGEFLSVHRTYLEQHRDGRWTKVDFGDGPTKMCLGAMGGGYISISKGASGKTMANAPDGDAIVICEGIEDALHIASARPHLRVIAAISLGNLSKIALPPAIEHITVFADNDQKPDAIKGFERAKLELIERYGDRDLRVARVPMQFKDVDDAVRGVGRDEGRGAA